MRLRTLFSLFAVLAMVGVAGAQDILINEVDADTDGTDILEFIELFGAPSMALDGLVVVLFNGSDDASYSAFDLDGFTTDADGFFLMGNPDVIPTPALIFPSNGLQNGADAVAIFVGNAEDFPEDTPVTTENLIDAIVYDTNDPDDEGLLVLLLPGEPQLNEAELGSSAFDSNMRCPDGGGGARVTSDCEQGVPTPGTTNEPSCGGGPVLPTDMTLCEAVELDGDGNAIHDGEYVHITSPLLILTNDGTYAVDRIDCAATDGDCCVYLFDYDYHVVLMEGDLYDVVGYIEIYNGKVEITGLQDGLTLISTGNPLPTPELITTEELVLNGNQYESCLITIDNLTIVGGDPWPPEGSDANIEVADETLVPATLRIDQDTNIDGTPEPLAPFQATGIGGQYDYTSPYLEGFQLLPRYIEDIIPGTLPEAACCVGHDCTVVTEEECFAINGIWLPDVPTCEPNPCDQFTPVNDASWGQIKGMFK